MNIKQIKRLATHGLKVFSLCLSISSLWASGEEFVGMPLPSQVHVQSTHSKPNSLALLPNEVANHFATYLPKGELLFLARANKATHESLETQLKERQFVHANLPLIITSLRMNRVGIHFQTQLGLIYEIIGLYTNLTHCVDPTNGSEAFLTYLQNNKQSIIGSLARLCNKNAVALVDNIFSGTITDDSLIFVTKEEATAQKSSLETQLQNAPEAQLVVMAMPEESGVFNASSRVLPDNLKYVHFVDANGSIKTLEDCFLAGHKSLRTVCMENFIQLESIGNAFCCGAERLEALNFSGFLSLKMIGGGFCDSTSVQSFDLSDYPVLTTIENSFFSNTKCLESVRISKCPLLEKIAADFCFNATGLKSVEISDCPKLEIIEDDFCDEAIFLEKVVIAACEKMSDESKANIKPALDLIKQKQEEVARLLAQNAHLTREEALYRANVKMAIPIVTSDLYNRLNARGITKGPIFDFYGYIQTVLEAIDRVQFEEVKAAFEQANIFNDELHRY